MTTVRLRLLELLEENGLSKYKLANEFPSSGNSTIYRMLDQEKPPIAIRFSTLGLLIDALIYLTDKEIKITDILEVTHDTTT